MKKMRMLLFAAATALCTSLSSCDNEEKFENLPASVQKAFSQKYPDARFQEWEQKKGYYVLDFRNKGVQAEAWFNSDSWLMTETDVKKNGLPQAVLEAFAATEFAGWRIEDIDMIERSVMETIYVIEVERGEVEVDLSFLEDGTLIRVDYDDDDDSYLPEIPSQIMFALDEMYPGAVVRDIDYEHGMFEIEIFHDRIKKEILFGHDFGWVSTSWEVSKRDLPELVTVYLEANYAGYKIDDVDFFTTPAGDYFEIELERGEKEITIKISPLGELIM